MLLRNINRWLKKDRASYHYKNAAFVLALIICLGCVVLYFSWSTVPYREYTMTCVLRDMYDRKLNTNIDMNLGLSRGMIRERENKMERMLSEDKYSLKIITHAEDDSTKTERMEERSNGFPFYEQLCDSLRAKGLPTDHDILFYAEIGDRNLNLSWLSDKYYWLFSSRNEEPEPKLVEIDGTYQLYPNPHVARRKTLQGERQKVCDGVKGNLLGNEFVCSTSGSIFKGALALEDISQAFVKLQFNPDNIEETFQCNVKTLHIDFGTVAELSPIYPMPDIVTATSIEYNDEEKIRQVLTDGLSFHMKYSIWANTQSTRMFLLATILTFALNTIAGFLIVFVVRMYHRIKPERSEDSSPLD